MTAAVTVIIRRLVKTRRSSGRRRALPAVGLVALAAYFVPAVPLALTSAWTRVHVSLSEGQDDAFAALVRQRGREYAEAIAKIRAALPENAEYLIIERDRGSDMIVRFDLAPRRARSGGFSGDVAVNVTPAKLASLPKWTVIPSFLPPGPRLVETRVIAEKGALP